MRRILATSLLLPSLFLPAAAKASQPMDDATAPTPNVRVSTGVTAPKLLGTPYLDLPSNLAEEFVPGNAQVGLTLTVDENGRPENIQVVKSLNPLWDASVVDAVRHFRFKPGTVSDQPTAVDLNLTVNIAR